jgi:predicted N-acetyltransferase YhbS
MIGRFPAQKGCQEAVVELRKETKDDWWEVEALFDLCFAPGREALSSYRLRDDVAPISNLCLVARDTLGILGGAVRYWEVSVADHPVLLLGPVAVHPTRQGEGLGGLLMNESLAQAKADDWERVMLVGDYAYYQRFGFSKLEHVTMPPPTNPDRVLGRALVDGAWDGISGTVQKKSLF